MRIEFMYVFVGLGGKRRKLARIVNPSDVMKKGAPRGIKEGETYVLSHTVTGRQIFVCKYNGRNLFFEAA